MPLKLVLEEFRNNLFQQDLLNRLFNFILDPGILRIIILLTNSLHGLKYCILNRFLNTFDFDKILILLNFNFQLFLISFLVNFCNATMASKKDKEKTDSKALVLKSESAVATSSPISSIELANRFSPFNSDLPVSYSSTLIYPFDPFVDFP
jgi:hypothetical protein